MSGGARTLLRICVAIAAALAVSASSCDWMHTSRPRGPKQGIIVQCNKPGAYLLVDDHPLGRLRARPIGLRPGPHRIEVRLRGHYSRYVDVVVKKGKISKVRVVMRPLLH